MLTLQVTIPSKKVFSKLVVKIRYLTAALLAGFHPMRAKSTKRFLHSSNYQQLTCILFEHSCFTLNKQTNLHPQIVPMLQNMGLKKSKLFKQLYQLCYNNQITDKHNIVTLLLPTFRYSRVFSSLKEDQLRSSQLNQAFTASFKCYITVAVVNTFCQTGNPYEAGKLFPENFLLLPVSIKLYLKTLLMLGVQTVRQSEVIHKSYYKT